jgi:hypothetical protein
MNILLFNFVIFYNLCLILQFDLKIKNFTIYKTKIIKIKMNYERLDIVQVIKDNPLGSLSTQNESKLIQKVKNTFSNNEEKLFLSSFYCYLKYDSKKDFVINLEDVWKWCGFSRKDHVKEY